MNTYLKSLFIACITLMTLACTNTKSPVPQTKVNAENQSITIQDPEQALSEIQILARDFDANRNLENLQINLLQLANTSIDEQNCTKSDIIIERIQSSLPPNLLDVATLFKAECNLVKLQQIPETQIKTPIIKQTERWLTSINVQSLLVFDSFSPFENTISLIDRKVIASAMLNAAKGQQSTAIDQLLNLENPHRFFDKSYFGNHLWEWFTVLDPLTRAELSKKFPQLLQYDTLIQTIEDDTINDTVRKVVISNLVISEQVKEELIPDQVMTYLSLNTKDAQRIAVLLPLTGRMSSQGEAIRHGLLSSYLRSLESSDLNDGDYLTTIDFIDTGSFETLKSDVNSERLLAYDTIIGPLLRSHVNQINNMPLSDKNKLLLNKSSILNSYSDIDSNLIATFSLSPEQEAAQIATLMREQGVKNPILVSDNSNISNRMVDAFLASWQVSEANSMKHTTPQIVKYTDNKGMKVGITSALGVLQSEKRIKQLTNLTQERVISVTRNRRDIDSFVVFARPNDVELINPIIESSISLFSDKQIPVFASSYSYDHKQNKNTQRDLRNLVFIDMPWLLPTMRNSDFAVQVDQLFNNPPSTFLRLFAFGYDALSIAENLDKLTTFKHIHHEGLSGRLSSDRSYEFIRQLDYLRIANN